MSHDFDASAALLEQVNHALNSATPLRIQGSGSKAHLGRATAGEVLDTRLHRGIVSYDPTELVLTARAGTPLSEIEAALEANNQMLPCEPPHLGDGATLGGMVAAGLSGPRRPWAGSVRDQVLGTRVITGQGKLLRFGGEVMKNVAGYDLSRLMAGSFGCLGLLAEVSIKVLPKPRQVLSLRLQVDALHALRRLSLPANSGLLDLPGRQLIDWGGAQRWLKSDADGELIQRVTAKLGGHATCFTAGQAQPFQPLAAMLLRYQRQLKNQLDPQGIFNPGRMYAEV